MRGIVNILGLLLLFAFLAFMILTIPLIPLWFLVVFLGAKKRVAKAGTKLVSTLMQGETVVHSAVEKRPFALLSRRALIGITDSRVISIKRGLFGGYKMRDQQWKDLVDVRIDENVLPGAFGSNLEFEFSTVSRALPITIDGVDSETASKIYGYAQAQEQAWEEKRRVRELEDKRAMAGGITLHGGHPFTPYQQPANPAPTQPAVQQSGDGVSGELSKAKGLLDAGMITDAEFQEIKSKILSRHFQ